MNTTTFTAGAGASGGNSLLLWKPSRALPPATILHYAPARNGGHRLACRCALCLRDTSLTRRVLRAICAPRRNRFNTRPSPLLPRLARGAAITAATAAACLAYLALGAWLDA